ncbi:MAG: PEGA domain-containing protein [Lachnospiraceae bacterium]|nr:PEGA domain-containing protein [Lachnospiraceae bacterium]
MSYQPKKDNGFVTKMLIFLIAALVLLIVYFLVSNEDKSKESGKKPTPSPALTEEVKKEDDINLGTYLFVEYDSSKEILVFHDNYSGENKYIPVLNTTLIYDSFNVPIAKTQLRFGEMYNIYVDSENNNLKRVEGSNLLWEKKYQTGIKVNKELGRITFGETLNPDGTTSMVSNYRFTDALFVVSNGQEYSLDKLSGIDMVTIRGLGEVVYEIIVTKGHGNLALTNDEDFYGGTLYAGSYEFTIDPHKTYTLKEGTYKMVLSKGSFNAEADIEIKRDETLIFDAISYGSGPKEYAQVRFTVDPLFAEVFINGEKTDYYNKELTLLYGDYDIIVSLGGYETYNEKLTVDKAEINKQIWLNELPEEGSEEE